MDDKDKLIEELRKENKRLKSQVYYYKNRDKNKNKKETSSSAWDFHYSGHGDYMEEMRCFYGNFS